MLSHSSKIHFRTYNNLFSSLILPQQVCTSLGTSLPLNLIISSLSKMSFVVSLEGAPLLLKTPLLLKLNILLLYSIQFFREVILIYHQCQSQDLLIKPCILNLEISFITKRYFNISSKVMNSSHRITHPQIKWIYGKTPIIALN